jgi:hypothetical protein
MFVFHITGISMSGPVEDDNERPFILRRARTLSDRVLDG